ncbi:MAG: molecular chaperone DnaK, partial [Oxalobacteraceae bacterium]
SITGGEGLNDSDIERMVNDAKDNEAEDKKKREEIDLRNRADSLCYQVERSVEEYKDKLDQATREQIEAKIKSTREALAGTDADKIKGEMEALTQASHKMAEQMYKTSNGAEAQNAAPEGGAAQANPSNKEGGQVVDAEFEDNN